MPVTPRIEPRTASRLDTPSWASTRGLIVVTEAPVSSSSFTLPASLIRALTRMAWPGVKRICPPPATTAPVARPEG